LLPTWTGVIGSYASESAHGTVFGIARTARSNPSSVRRAANSPASDGQTSSTWCVQLSAGITSEA